MRAYAEIEVAGPAGVSSQQHLRDDDLLPESPDGGFEAWASWAESSADRMDPLGAR
jgi:hypothetical protein